MPLLTPRIEIALDIAVTVIDRVVEGNRESGALRLHDAATPELTPQL